MTLHKDSVQIYISTMTQSKSLIYVLNVQCFLCGYLTVYWKTSRYERIKCQAVFVRVQHICISEFYMNAVIRFIKPDENLNSLLGGFVNDL